jgi:hypothetical protein
MSPLNPPPNNREKLEARPVAHADYGLRADKSRSGPGLKAESSKQEVDPRVLDSLPFNLVLIHPRALLLPP